jgi:hypothetical protein
LYFRFYFWLLNGSSRRNHKVSKSAALAGQHSTQGRRPTCMRQMSKFNWAHRLMTITKFVIVISWVG